MWDSSFKRLEDSHDYIQWLFPLNEPSAHNSNAPILTKEDIEEFRNSPRLRWALLTSVHIFVRFLHFTTRNWVSSFDHNQLRITRMLKCLMLLGLEEYARVLLDEILLIVDCHGPDDGKHSARQQMSRAIGFWKDAVPEPGTINFGKCKDCGKSIPSKLTSGGEIVLPRDIMCDECWDKSLVRDPFHDWIEIHCELDD